MRRLFLAVMLALTTGAYAVAAPTEGERDWFGPPPICC